MRVPEHQTLSLKALLGSSSEVFNMQEYLHSASMVQLLLGRDKICAARI